MSATLQDKIARYCQEQGITLKNADEVEAALDEALDAILPRMIHNIGDLLTPGDDSGGAGDTQPVAGGPDGGNSARPGEPSLQAQPTDPSGRAHVHIDAHCLDEIEAELKALQVTVEAVDPPWDYKFSGSRAALETMLRNHWGLPEDELQEVLKRIEG